MQGRPIISFDLDGVLAVWPFGVNPGVSPRPKPVPPLPPDAEERYRSAPSSSSLRGLIEALRFMWRRPDSDARRTLESLSRGAAIVITTGRSAAGRGVVQAWLRRHGLAPFIDNVYLSPPSLRTRHHKLVTLQRIGARAHVDDDPTAVWFLAQNGVSRPIFREWPVTARTATPPGVFRIRRLVELLDLELV